MHPWFAVWMWTLAMTRVCQNSLAPADEVASKTGRDVSETPAPIFVKAARYLKFEVTERPLPDFLLDQLADLHWAEREPAMPV